jgi:hypothetical protein
MTKEKKSSVRMFPIEMKNIRKGCRRLILAMWS